jgi:hypothetical protein
MPVYRGAIAIMVGQDAAIECVVVRVTPDGRLTRSDAALYLGLQPATLANWALRAYGPRPSRIGRRVFYRKADLDAFIAGEAA